MRIHPDTIEEVKQRADIVDVIADYVVLKKKGKNYSGLCPFHDEKTPSFTVSPIKQIYYCFGCGAGGNAIKFLMELGKQSFTDVVLDLARRYQVPVKTLEASQKKEYQRQLSLREQLYEILAVTATFYHYALYQPQGEKALEYLLQQRRLAPETIQQFQLGYAPAGWETLYHYLVEQKRYPVALVEDAGLIKPRNNDRGYYDQFRDRLMIPIADSQGRVIGFGGRSLDNSEPKYLNSPETVLFEKGKNLFGLDRAKQAIQKQDKAIIVEGYFDVIALQAAGITNTVAALGTALSSAQVKLLLRFTESKQIIFNFDADKAGIKATQRAIAEIEPLVYSGQVNLRILNLPAGKDADEFIRDAPQGVTQYHQLIEQAPLWLDWQIQQLLVNRNLKQSDHFEQVVQGMLKILRQLEDHTKRTYYVQYCAEILSQGDTHFISTYARNLFSKLTQVNLKSPPPKPSKPDHHLQHKLKGFQAEEQVLQIYIQEPHLRDAILETLETKDILFHFTAHRLLWQLILKFHEENPNFEEKENQLLAQLNNDYLNLNTEERSSLYHIFYLDEIDKEHIYRPELAFTTAIISLEIFTWLEYRRYCLEQLPKAPLEKQAYYWQESQKAAQKITELDKQRSQANL